MTFPFNRVYSNPQLSHTHTHTHDFLVTHDQHNKSFNFFLPIEQLVFLLLILTATGGLWLDSARYCKGGRRQSLLL